MLIQCSNNLTIWKNIVTIIAEKLDILLAGEGDFA